MGSSVRLLVINPNTNPVVTTRIRELCERVVAPGTEVVVVNPVTGPDTIETSADRDAAVPGVLSIVEARRAERYDGYVMACFDNIGIRELRGMVDGPVVSTCDAGIAVARTLCLRFAIVTTVAEAIPTITGLIEHNGVRDICTVRAAGIGVAAAADMGPAEERKIRQAMHLAVEEDGAEVILLGSGGLSGRVETLANGFMCPIVDGVAAAVKMAEGVAALRLAGNGSWVNGR